MASVLGSAAPGQSVPQRPALLRQAFISHTGLDNDVGINPANFAASLAERLKRDSVSTFIDYQFLKAGYDWSDHIVEHAKRSEVMVVVFSKSYSRRYWCMRELDLAMQAVEAGAAITIIPVCYGVANLDGFREPAQLAEWREQWHDFVQQGREGVDAQRWQNNLQRLDRYHHALQFTLRERERKGSESELLHRVALSVFQRLAPLLQVPAVGDFVAGIEDSVEHVKQLLLESRSGGTSVVAILGPGGMGKSTLARAVFNYLLGDFPGAAASVEVGDVASAHTALTVLLAGLNVERVSKTSLASMRLQLREVLRVRGPMLLLLDSLWSSDILMDVLSSVPQGSRVIVTTRHQSVVEDVPDAKLFAMPGLTDGAALVLLRHHCGDGARDPSAEPSSLQHLEAKIVQACGGMPLVLEVTGNLLRTDWTESHWQATLDRLQSGALLGCRVDEIAELSVADLPPFARSMFLDAATVMHRRQETHALAAWSTMTAASFQAARWLGELKSRSLVGADKEGNLRVHDVLRALARRMALAEYPVTRVWQSDQIPSSEVRAIALRDLKQLSSLNLQTMTSLEVLLLNSIDDASPEQLSKILSTLPGRRLKWLSLPPGYTKVLSTQAWWLQWLPPARESIAMFACPRLAVLDLSRCRGPPPLASVPQLAALGVLSMNNCWELYSLPASFGELSTLMRLDLSMCVELICLPDSFGKLAALAELDMSRCRSLRRLPESFGELTALTRLYLSGCEQLARLPGSFGHLTALTQLDLSLCTMLSSLPDSFGNLTALTMLNMDSCEQLVMLPESFDSLQALTMLSMDDCRLLSCLPEALGRLAALNALDISMCTALSSLPGSFGKLAALTELDMSRCTSMATLPESFSSLTALRRLDVSGTFTSLVRLDSATVFVTLRNLADNGCKIDTGLLRERLALVNLGNEGDTTRRGKAHAAQYLKSGGAAADELLSPTASMTKFSERTSNATGSTLRGMQLGVRRRGSDEWSYSAIADDADRSQASSDGSAESWHGSDVAQAPPRSPAHKEEVLTEELLPIANEQRFTSVWSGIEVVVPPGSVRVKQQIRITVVPGDGVMGTVVEGISGDPYIMWSPLLRGQGTLHQGQQLELRFPACVCDHCREHPAAIFTLPEAADSNSAAKWTEVAGSKFVAESKTVNVSVTGFSWFGRAINYIKCRGVSRHTVHVLADHLLPCRGIIRRSINEIYHASVDTSAKYVVNACTSERFWVVALLPADESSASDESPPDDMEVQRMRVTARGERIADPAKITVGGANAARVYIFNREDKAGGIEVWCMNQVECGDGLLLCPCDDGRIPITPFPSQLRKKGYTPGPVTRSRTGQVPAVLQVPAPAPRAPLSPRNQAFISHTGQDDSWDWRHTSSSSAFAQALAAYAQLQGVPRFIDTDSIKGAEDWRDRIEDDARRSKVMVVVLTASYTRRKWCMLEVQYALKEGRLILPVHYGHIDDNTFVADGTLRKHWRSEGATKKEVKLWAANLLKIDRPNALRRTKYNCKDGDLQLQKDIVERLRELLELPEPLQDEPAGPMR